MPKSKGRRFEPWEDDVLRSKYPDYAAILEALPHRDYQSLRNRVRQLGLAKKRFRWSPSLRRALRDSGFETFNNREIAELLNCNYRSVQYLRRAMGLSHPVPKAREPRSPLVLEIRQRAKDLEMPLQVLFRLAHCNKSALHRSVQYAQARRMVRVLGGELYAEWED